MVWCDDVFRECVSLRDWNAGASQFCRKGGLRNVHGPAFSFFRRFLN